MESLNELFLLASVILDDGIDFQAFLDGKALFVWLSSASWVASIIIRLFLGTWLSQTSKFQLRGRERS